MSVPDIRHLFGETYKSYEITIEATDPACLSKLLVAATELVLDVDPESVVLHGIHLNSSDRFVLEVICSVS